MNKGELLINEIRSRRWDTECRAYKDNSKKTEACFQVRKRRLVTDSLYKNLKIWLQSEVFLFFHLDDSA